MQIVWAISWVYCHKREHQNSRVTRKNWQTKWRKWQWQNWPQLTSASRLLSERSYDAKPDSRNFASYRNASIFCNLHEIFGIGRFLRRVRVGPILPNHRYSIIRLVIVSSSIKTQMEGNCVVLIEVKRFSQLISTVQSLAHNQAENSNFYPNLSYQAFIPFVTPRNIVKGIG